MADVKLRQDQTHPMLGRPKDKSSNEKPSEIENEPSSWDVLGKIHTLLGRVGESRVEPVAYDTAWVARLGDVDGELSAQALAWLRAHQLPDGSWGAPTPLYHHDRVISTLAAITALIHHNAPEDRPRIQAALPALQHSLANLHQDAAGRTVAFEMLLPSLVAEAKRLGITIADPDGIVAKMAHLRAAKLANSPKGLISRQTTLGFSAEMVGPDGLHLLDAEDLQYQDGSICVSPAATAFFATYVRADPAALRYLRRVTHQGGAPTITAIEVFERAWTLWDLAHSGVNDDKISACARTHLEALASAWHPGCGIAMNDIFLVQDGDHTGIVCELLTRDGRAPDLTAIWRYEEETHFRCYALENETSISANLHILGALRQVGLRSDHPAVQKIASFLDHKRTGGAFWIDKWHSSPYYPTSLATLVCAGYLNQLVEAAVNWMITTQNANGSWGYFVPTAEETAYCLRALITWHQQGLDVPQEVLTRGAAWLAEHVSPPYIPLWISKSLYCPTLVVQSAVLSTLWQYEHTFGKLP